MAANKIEPYDFTAIEARWRNFWSKRGFFRVDTTSCENTFYYLNMFPYPSGHLHVGHGRNYIIGDLITRVKIMRGLRVLNPMGWDAFGLPAENAAIENETHPWTYTKANIEKSKEQFRAWGVQFDWDREVTTCLPDYYRWTQWLFLELYKHGLAYKKKATVNYCPTCDTVLANEQVVGGACERCGTPPEKKELEQWFFKITDYADRLLNDLDQLAEWPENVLKMQENWIGRSEGAEVVFTTEAGDSIPVFTTRPDTLWGATFMVLAPEHPVVQKLMTEEQRAAVATYQQQAERETEIDRLSTEREKSGVFTGGFAINPVNGARIPVWIADYVLMTYGTGAIMAVPAHDERDFEFALKFGLPILPVIQRLDGLVKSSVPTGTTGRGFDQALRDARIPFESADGGGEATVPLDVVDRYAEIAKAVAPHRGHVGLREGASPAGFMDRCRRCSLAVRLSRRGHRVGRDGDRVRDPQSLSASRTEAGISTQRHGNPDEASRLLRRPLPRRLRDDDPLRRVLWHAGNRGEGVRHPMARGKGAWERRDQLPSARLADLPPAVLGRAHPDRSLRRVRRGPGAR